MECMELNKREKVHAIEFLALLAFIARERQRLTREVVARAQFTHNDLAMAYAFQSRFGPPPPGGLLKPFQPSSQNLSGQQQQQQQHQSFSPPSSVMVPRSMSDSPLGHYQPTAIAGDGNGEGYKDLYPPIQHSSTFGSPTQLNQVQASSRGSMNMSPTHTSPERLQQSWRDSGKIFSTISMDFEYLLQLLQRERMRYKT